MSQVLVVGIDGGTLDLIRRWSEAGELPNLARLMAEGVHGPLESTIPPVSSPAWPTFATGKNPGKHGVFDFIRPTGGRFDMVTASSLRAPTLWQILSEAGKRVGVMNVPVTYPPAPVNGFLISGMLSPVDGTFTYPPDLLARYAGLMKPYRIAPRIQYKLGKEADFAADMLDLIERRRAYALQLMRDCPYDFLMFNFQATDVMSHALWKFVDPTHPLYDAQAALRLGPVLKHAYQLIDDFVGQALDHLTGDTNVIVMSDHGFGPLHYVVNLNLFLLDHGHLQLRRGVWTRLKTALFRAGITPTSVWHVIERAGLQNYVWQVSKSTRNKMVSKFLSFDDVDWSRTRAYAIGHVGQIYVNLKGRQPAGVVEPGAAYGHVRREVVEGLRELRHPQTRQPLVDRVIPSEEITHGPYADRGPDLHVVFDGHRSISFPLFATDSRVVTRQIRGDSGCHRPEGVFIAWGPEIRSGASVTDARIMDLTPTILHLMGLPVSDDMDGRVLAEALTITRPVTYERAKREDRSIETGLASEEAAAVEDRLRALGYLG